MSMGFVKVRWVPSCPRYSVQYELVLGVPSPLNYTVGTAQWRYSGTLDGVLRTVAILGMIEVPGQ